AGEGAVRVRLPVASLNLLQLRNEELIPDPNRRAQCGLGRKLTLNAMVAGAIDATFLGDNLRGWCVDVFADYIDALIDQSGGGGALLNWIVPRPGEDDRQCRTGIHLLRA